MKPQHTLLSWAAPASRDFCHRASGGSRTGREHQWEQRIQEGVYNPLQLDVPVGIILRGQSTESMELEERLRGPRHSRAKEQAVLLAISCFLGMQPHLCAHPRSRAAFGTVTPAPHMVWPTTLGPLTGSLPTCFVVQRGYLNTHKGSAKGTQRPA